MLTMTTSGNALGQGIGAYNGAYAQQRAQSVWDSQISVRNISAGDYSLAYNPPSCRPEPEINKLLLLEEDV
jgi:hypothetical protein